MRFLRIWVQSGGAPSLARVLEVTNLPPYEGEDGLGSRNAPGLSRLKTATFTGEYPLAHIDFEDPGSGHRQSRRLLALHSA